MRIRLFATLCLIAVPLFARADEASHRAKAEQMISATKVDTISQQMLASVPQRVRQTASRQVVVQAATTPGQKKLTSDYLDQMETIAKGGTSWAAIHPKIVDLYVNAFTEADMDSILAFYKTPGGQALIAKTPEVSGKTFDLLQSSLNSLGPQFKAATEAYETEMQNTNPVSGAAGALDSVAPDQKPPSLGPDAPTTKKK